MKNRKTSYSLSKLNFIKNDLHQTSQRSFKRKHSRKANRSEIQQPDINNLRQSPHNEAVLNEYYGTSKQRMVTSENDTGLIESKKKRATERFANDIEYKMRRVIENHEFDSDINLDNIVLEQSDVDQEFENKILENKQLLKGQREKQNFTHSQQKLHTQIDLLIQKRETKKSSLIKNLVQKPLRKHKTKSLLPTIGVSSSKVLNLGDLKYDKNRHYNQSERKNHKLTNLLPNIRESPPEQLKEEHHPSRIESKHSLVPKQSEELKKDEKSNRKFTQKVNIKKTNKKIVQLKLQSKIEQLKNRIGQRTSAKEPKTRNTDKRIDLPPKKRHSRYSSHSVFDNIQEFLSNPHENNTKSQRKFLKLYQKIDESDQTFQKQKEVLQKKIQQIEAKIQTFMMDRKDDLIEMQKIEKPHRPTSTGSSPMEETDSQFGALEWRRLERERIEKSSFENELKYVKSLEEKGHNNLMKYIENKKILNQLKMLKKTQEILSKNTIHNRQNTKMDVYTSL